MLKKLFSILFLSLFISIGNHSYTYATPYIPLIDEYDYTKFLLTINAITRNNAPKELSHRACLSKPLKVPNDGALPNDYIKYVSETGSRACIQVGVKQDIPYVINIIYNRNNANQAQDGEWLIKVVQILLGIDESS